MTSKSLLTYSTRARFHSHPVARKLFTIAEAKRSNLIVSADFSNTNGLLECADSLGPYIAVFKTHIDLVSDFSEATVAGLKSLAAKHNFLIFEDRKFVDIGTTAQKQYHGGALRISEWADIVNLSILGGESVVQALAQTVSSDSFPYPHQRALLVLAEMTTSGSLAIGRYTELCVEAARKYSGVVMGFVATRSLGAKSQAHECKTDDDFVVFTTGVSRNQKGDNFGQQYQSPATAIKGGSDFIIAGRGIYASDDPVTTAKAYQQEGWEAYQERVGRSGQNTV
ncbi:orotidine 5'-phosphate decarboxylase [Dactylonectria estremocensis]|uniref:Orotidine 5'-phosphate decarboxylase n=1 Tax=Dactylonectria estremocensis TaxID=1079267 RepID=A0A9P9JAW0_9HYPO|nr:orotidine 5'-phosphate decarboxylase [Dactylonectria estremocensis]